MLLVQDLLVAKRELQLRKEIIMLAKYEGLVIDEMGYVQQSREEMKVLFTFLAEHYERGSGLLTSSLPFSRWDEIFRDAMTTAASGTSLRDPETQHTELTHGASEEEPSFRNAASRNSEGEASMIFFTMKSAAANGCAQSRFHAPSINGLMRRGEF